MRLPLTANISTKDGVLAKNARMTNVLEQKNKSGKTVAEIRPGTEVVGEFGASSGNGIVDFNGTLLSVFDSQLSIVDITPPEIVSFPHVEYIESPYSGDYAYVTDICLGATEVGYSNILITGNTYHSGDPANTDFMWTESGGIVDICLEYNDAGGARCSASGTVYGIGKDVAQGNASTLYVYDGSLSYVDLGSWTSIGTLNGVHKSTGYAAGRGVMSGVSHGVFYDGTTVFDIGLVSGGLESNAYSVSANKVVAGSYRDSSNILHPMIWTEADGITDLGSLGGTPAAGGASNLVGAYYISSDGTVVFGKSRNSGGTYRAFKWTEVGGMVDLDAGLSYTSINIANIGEINPDGTALVGNVTISGVQKAFVWQEGTGFTLLTRVGEAFSSASGVSDDGLTVVGFSSTSLNVYSAWKWTLANGITVIDVSTTFPSCTQVSGDATAFAGEGEGLNGSWVLGGHDVNPTFRDLVAINNDKMDFVQSTL